MSLILLVVGFVVGVAWGLRHDIRRELDGTGPVPEGWERVRPFVFRRRG